MKSVRVVWISTLIKSLNQKIILLQNGWSKKIHVRDFIAKNNNFSNRHPQNFNVKMRLNIGKQHCGKKILYWASNEKKGTNLNVNDARTAYGNFSNSGIATIHKSGEVLLKIACPQIYHTTAANKSKPQSYYRHLHFVFSNEKKRQMDGSNIYQNCGM